MCFTMKTNNWWTGHPKPNGAISLLKTYQINNTGYFRKSISFRNLINWPALLQAISNFYGPDCRDRRIHRLHFCRRVRLPANECPGYDTKQSDGKVPVMLKLWGMWSIPLLPLLPGPLCSGSVASYRVLFIGQIELNCVIMQKWIV